MPIDLSSNEKMSHVFIFLDEMSFPAFALLSQNKNRKSFNTECQHRQQLLTIRAHVWYHSLLYLVKN